MAALPYTPLMEEFSRNNTGKLMYLVIRKHNHKNNIKLVGLFDSEMHAIQILNEAQFSVKNMKHSIVEMEVNRINCSIPLRLNNDAPQSAQ